MAVFTDHVQLPNAVLEDKTHTHTHKQDKFTLFTDYQTTTTLKNLQHTLETFVHSVTGLGHLLSTAVSQSQE